jgi:hypothetical protein
MKGFFLAALAVAALTMNNEAKAQQGFSLSVKATPQFSFLQNQDDNDNSRLEKKATFTASFGAGAAYNFTNRSGVGLDVLYSLQGQRYKTNGVETNQKINYMKLPLYFAYNTDATRPVSFTAKIGPQLSILTDSRLTDKDGNDIKSDTKDRYKDATVGGMAAAGLQFKLDKQLFLTTTARFDYDFTNAEDDTYPHYSSGRADTHNMTTGVEVGLKYMLR